MGVRRINTRPLASSPSQWISKCHTGSQRFPKRQRTAARQNLSGFAKGPGVRQSSPALETAEHSLGVHNNSNKFRHLRHYGFDREDQTTASSAFLTCKTDWS